MDMEGRRRFESEIRKVSVVISELLPPFHNIGRFVISRCITNTMNLEKPKRPTFWNGGSTFIK